MHRLLILLFFLSAALPLAAQEEEADAVGISETDSAEPSEPAGRPGNESDEERDEERAEEGDKALDAEIDDPDELYGEDEDVFIPSEDVKFGQSIPFPTDI